MSSYWWIWIVAGLVLIIGEFFTESFYLSCLGAGAVVAGILGMVELNIYWQVGAFIVISIALLPVAIKIGKWIRKNTPEGVGSERYVGKTVIVTEEIDNLKNTGMVRLEGNVWRAESANDSDIIEPESKVRVEDVKGTRLVVTRDQQEERK